MMATEKKPLFNCYWVQPSLFTEFLSISTIPLNLIFIALMNLTGSSSLKPIF